MRWRQRWYVEKREEMCRKRNRRWEVARERMGRTVRREAIMISALSVTIAWRNGSLASAVVLRGDERS